MHLVDSQVFRFETLVCSQPSSWTSLPCPGSSGELLCGSCDGQVVSSLGLSQPRAGKDSHQQYLGFSGGGGGPWWILASLNLRTVFLSGRRAEWFLLLVMLPLGTRAFLGSTLTAVSSRKGSLRTPVSGLILELLFQLPQPWGDLGPAEEL